jgi:hypothetical protein
MPTISYTAANFPAIYGSNLAGIHDLEVSWGELIWAALTVGKARLQNLTQYGVFSVFEATYRAAIIYANLREASDGVLVRSSAYDGLDPSEKGAISYFIGLTVVKLFSNRLLNVPWLMHLDVYREDLQAVLVGRSRPDLVGLNTNYDWVVVEAKGRTNDFERPTLQQAKVQAQQISTIQGTQPVLRVGSLAYFDEGSLRFAIRDPEGHTRRERIPDLPLTKDMLRTGYYRPFHAWLEESALVEEAVIHDRPYIIASIPEFDLSVGLPDQVKRPDKLAPGTRERRRRVESQFVGGDDVLVQLGPVWSGANMKLEAQERHR